MEKDGPAICEKCNNDIFVVDNERSEIEFPVQPIRFEIDGVTKLIYKKVFFCCNKCGWTLPGEIKEHQIGESYTVSFTLKPKK